jgi:hypothetical protein
MGLTVSELDYLYALGHYPHKVSLHRGIMDMSRAIEEIEAWLKLRKAVYHMDVYAMYAHFLFLDENIAMEFKMRFV